MNKNKFFSLLYSKKTVAILISALLLSGCSNTHNRRAFPSPSSNDTHCDNASRYAGRVVGDGHCVALIRTCSSAPNTQFWRPGPYVLSQPSTAIRPGTIIATFLNGKYPNKTGWHAAIYISHNSDGIWVWDQWIGKPVHKRFIHHRRDNASAGNTAQQYQIVNFNL